MKTTKAYSNGFQLAIRSPRMIFSVYFSNFLLVALFALTFNSIIKAAVGSSMILDDFMKNGYLLLLQDLFHNSGKVSLAIFAQVKWGILAYWILNLFLVGGIIRTFNKQRYSLNMFYGGAAYNFPRFFGLSFLMFLTHILLLVVVGIGAAFVLKSSYANASSERILILQGIGFAILYFVFAIIIFLASDFGKFYLLLEDSKNFLKAYLKGFRYALRHLFKVYFLYILLLIIPFLFFYLFTKVNNDIGMKTITGIIIMFFIQQIFIYIRFGFRIWILGSLFEVYTDDFLMDKKIALDKERIQELEQKQAELATMANKNTLPETEETKAENKSENKTENTNKETDDNSDDK